MREPQKTVSQSQIKPKLNIIKRVETVTEFQQGDSSNIVDESDDVPEITNKKHTSKKYDEVDWPEILAKKKCELYEYFTSIWLRLTAEIHRKKFCETLRLYYICKVSKLIYDEELDYIRTEELKFIEEVKSNSSPSKVYEKGPITGYFFKEQNSIKEKRDYLLKQMAEILKPKIKKERIEVFVELIRQKLEKYKLEDITHETVNMAAKAVLETMLEDPVRNFEYGVGYSQDEVQRLKDNIFEVLHHNACYIPALQILLKDTDYMTFSQSGNLAVNYLETKERPASRYRVVKKRPLHIRQRYDYSDPVEAKKEEYIPKIRKFYQDEAIERYRDQIDILTEKFICQNELDEDVPLPLEIQEEIKSRALANVYQYYDTYKKDAIKKQAKVVSKISPSTARVKEFIVSHYVINPTNTATGTHSCDLYESYKKWMADTQPTEPVISHICFGKVIANKDIMGVEVQRYSNGRKQGWKLVPKNAISGLPSPHSGLPSPHSGLPSPHSSLRQF